MQHIITYFNFVYQRVMMFHKDHDFQVLCTDPQNRGQKTLNIYF